MPYFVFGNGKQEGPDRLDNYYSITLSLLINYTMLLYLYKKEIQLCQDQY